MDKERKLEIQLSCSLSVSGIFAFFMNEKNRDPDFKWSDFSKIAETHWKESIGVFLDFESKEEEAVAMNFAKNYAKSVGDNLIRQAGLNAKLTQTNTKKKQESDVNDQTSVVALTDSD